MTADLYTDAGIREGTGTWAFVFVVDGIPVLEASGRFRSKLDCSTSAELQAVANAVHHVRRSGHLARGDVIVVRSDSLRAVERVNGRLFNLHTRTAKLVAAGEQVDRIAREAGITLRGEWVKGHQPIASTDPHAVHNRRCDALCREARLLPKPKRSAGTSDARKTEVQR